MAAAAAATVAAGVTASPHWPTEVRLIASGLSCGTHRRRAATRSATAPNIGPIRRTRRKCSRSYAGRTPYASCGSNRHGRRSLGSARSSRSRGGGRSPGSSGRSSTNTVGNGAATYCGSARSGRRRGSGTDWLLSGENRESGRLNVLQGSPCISCMCKALPRISSQPISRSDYYFSSVQAENDPGGPCFPVIESTISWTKRSSYSPQAKRIRGANTSWPINKQTTKKA